MLQYLQSTPTVNSDHPTIVEFAATNAGSTDNHRDQAISLYYKVRDSILYDPYSIKLTVEGLSASATLKTGRGWCVAKAILLAASCRAQGIPARLGFADVRNHLSTERIRKYMKTDIFYWHGYTSIYLDGGWVKATPAFNLELCEKFRLKPLDFDGCNDAIYHPYDLTGRRHMEYVSDRGELADVPIAQIEQTFRKEYGLYSSLQKGNFDLEVERELPKDINE